MDPNYGLFWYTYIDYKTIVHLFHGYFSRRLIMDTRQFVPEQDSIKYILVLSQGSLILFSTYRENLPYIDQVRKNRYIYLSN